MHYFDYRNGALFAEDVAVSELAKAVGTPFYVYSAATIRRHFRVFSQAFAGLDTLVCYAMKANSNQAVLRLLATEGAGMDVVSGGELARALAAGVKGEKITFSGVGKTDDEIAAALDAGIFCFNVESEPELEAISQRRLGAGGEGARVSTRQSGRRRAHPQEDFDRQGREQIRRAAVARPRGLRPRRKSAGAENQRRRHAYRLAAHGPRTLRRSLYPARRTCWRPARRRP